MRSSLKTSRIMGLVFRDFRDDDSLRVCILRAAGEKFFCPGWDLKAAAEGDAVDGDYGVGGFGGLAGTAEPEQAGDRGRATASAAAAGWNWRCRRDLILCSDQRDLCAAGNPVGHGGRCGQHQAAQAHSLSCGDGPVADRALV